MKRSMVGKIRREICMGWDFGCMEKEKLPCGKSKMIGSHPPIDYFVLMHSRQRRPLLVKAIRRRVEGPRTIPHEGDLKIASQVRSTESKTSSLSSSVIIHCRFTNLSREQWWRQKDFMFKQGANDRLFVRILRLGPSIKCPALHELMQTYR